MKGLLILIMLSLFSPFGYAACSGTISKEETFIVKDDLMLGGEDIKPVDNSYTDSTCQSTDKISKLDTAEYIVGMGPGDSVKLKVKITWDDKSTTTPSQSGKAFAGAYKATVSEVNTSEAVNYSANGGYTVRIENAAVMTGATTQNSWQAFLSWGLCTLMTGNPRTCYTSVINALNGKGIYKSNLTIIYNRKETTCAPRNLTITLDPVPVNKLRTKGEISDYARQGDIILDCKNQVRDATLTSRQLSVSLRSDLVWDENASVLKPDTDNGAGFILKDAAHNPIKINKGSALTSVFKTYNKGSAVQSVETLPIFATYYVIDPAKVKAGKLQSKALIVVSYN